MRGVLRRFIFVLDIVIQWIISCRVDRLKALHNDIKYMLIYSIFKVIRFVTNSLQLAVTNREKSVKSDKKVKKVLALYGKLW